MSSELPSNNGGMFCARANSAHMAHALLKFEWARHCAESLCIHRADLFDITSDMAESHMLGA